MKQIQEHPNIQTSEHLDISEHSNIEHFNIRKIANINEHSNMNVRRSVAPAQKHPKFKSMYGVKITSLSLSAH